MSFETLLSEVFSAPTETEKGRRFEHVVLWTLRNAPQYRDLFSNVWLWDEWPGNDGRDIGIDVVAQPKDGSLPWAIQAKAYSDRYSITKKDIDSFISASPAKRFSYRLLVATTDLVGANARRAIETQGNFGELLRTSLEELHVSWPSSLRGLARDAAKPKPKKLWPHQSEALDDALAVLHKGKRAQVLMPCGTGKTLLGLWLSEERKARTTLFLAPSLALVRQTLQEWSANANVPFRWIAVCSDQTVADDQGKATRDSDTREHTSDLGVPVTTDPKEIAAFLGKRGRKVIFSTYQSSARVAAAVKLSGARIDLAICDEAHRLAGVTDRNFGSVLDDSRLPVHRRVFLTATPRIYGPRVKKSAEDAGVLVASMDDETVFGPVAHRLSFAEAIERKLLADYRVVVVGVLDSEYASVLNASSVLVKDTDKQADPRALAGLVALSKSMKRFKLSRVISFHSSVIRAQRFRSLAEDCLPVLPTTPKGKFVARHVNGTMTTSQRDRTLRTLRSLPGMRSMLVTNARCLTEGVDVPELDALVFADPRRSRIEVVQCVGRAIRKTTDDKVGTLILPVPVHPGENPEEALASSDFDGVWQVLCALRAHDERLAEEIDSLARRNAVSAVGGVPGQLVIDLPEGVFDLRAFNRAFSARVVEVAAASYQVGLGYCQAWRSEHGSLASVRQSSVVAGFKIGRWVQLRRSEHRRGTLALDRVAALEELGIVWEPFDKKWEDGLAACRAWTGEHGSLESVKQITAFHGFRLGSWLTNRRQERRLGTLDPERIAALDELGFSWDETDKPWQDGLATCRSWVTGGQSLAAVKSTTVFKGLRLGQWLVSRRGEYGRGTLALDRVAALEELGIVWEPFDKKWEDGLAACSAWTREHGSLESVRKESVFGEFRVGEWLHNIRQQNRRGKLDPQRAAALEELGFLWEPRDRRWRNALAFCEAWAATHGSLASVGTKEVFEGFRIGEWLDARRQMHRRGSLAPERVEALTELGMVWDLRDQLWQKGLAGCRGWVAKHGSLSSVRKETTLDGFKLGAWIGDRRLEMGLFDPNAPGADLFLHLGEARLALKSRTDLEQPYREHLVSLYKGWDNSLCSGIFLEVHPRGPRKRARKVSLIGPHGAYICSSRAYEEVGEYYFPPFYALVTGAGRLLLYLGMREVREAGGTVCYFDTDSLDVASSEDTRYYALPGDAP